MGHKKVDDDSLHSKAIRLLEGGVVSAEGLSVRLGYSLDPAGACLECEMDCLCHSDSEFLRLCAECEVISQKSCILILNEGCSSAP